MIRNFFFWLSLFFRRTRKGAVIVSSGSQNIEIHTCFTPTQVFVSPCSPHGIPVCGAEQDCFDVRIVPQGFVVLANLKSEKRVVKWIAIR